MPPVPPLWLRQWDGWRVGGRVNGRTKGGGRVWEVDRYWREGRTVGERDGGTRDGGRGKEDGRNGLKKQSGNYLDNHNI